LVEKELSDFIANGTLVWYYYICKREVWLIAHGIEPYQDDDFISLGRIIHETRYRNKKKELMVDDKIKIDLIANHKIIGEIKKSSKFLQSAKMQLAFYLYYLKQEKGISLSGELLIPEERKRIELTLTPALEKEIENAIKEIEKIAKLPKPPPATKNKYCRNCAYKEFCWS